MPIRVLFVSLAGEFTVVFWFPQTWVGILGLLLAHGALGKVF